MTLHGLHIANMPEPPAQKNAWPYNAEPSKATRKARAPECWPRISVITPSFNQGEFLERTILSVLRQEYPNLEYIVIDGGSSDESLEIIKKYASQLAYWTSEPDRGQSHAINKGFEKATGEIMCWLNSDDFYLPATLRTVAGHLARETGSMALAGHVLKVYTDGRPAEELAGRYENLRRLLQFWRGYQMHQPSIFWRREVFERVGFLDEAQQYIMDFDYWVRIARHFDFQNVDEVLSCITYHDKAKTGDNYRRYHEELRRQATTFWGSRRSLDYWRLKLSMMQHFRLLPLVRPLLQMGEYYGAAILHHLRGAHKLG